MAEVPPFTIAYLSRHPVSAAGALERMRPADAATLFETVPIRILVPVVDAMGKWHASACLAHLPVERAAAIVMALPYQSATVLLRLLPAERRGELLEQLPSSLARDLRQSLRYPRNTVGAWMDPSVPTLSIDSVAENAVSLVRAADGQLGHSIFVVDQGQHLAGVLRLQVLLRHDASARVADLMETGLSPLFARTLLRDAATLAAWDDHSHLPVAGRLGQVIGILARSELRRGLATISAVTAGLESRASLLSHAVEALFASAVGLLDLIDTDVSRPKRTGGQLTWPPS